MSVDDWARREAERRWPVKRDKFGLLTREEAAMYAIQRAGFEEGATTAFSALLSDEAVEAVEAMVRQWWELRESGPANLPVAMRAALQAAIDAVTKEARND